MTTIDARILANKEELVACIASATPEQLSALYLLIQQDGMMPTRLISLLVLDAASVALSGFAPNNDALKKYVEQERSFGILQQFIIGYMNYLAAIANKSTVVPEHPLTTMIRAGFPMIQRMIKVKQDFLRQGRSMSLAESDQFAAAVYDVACMAEKSPAHYLNAVELLGLINTEESKRLLRKLEADVEESAFNNQKIDSRYLSALKEALKTV